MRPPAIVLVGRIRLLTIVSAAGRAGPTGRSDMRADVWGVRGRRGSRGQQGGPRTTPCPFLGYALNQLHCLCQGQGPL